jgi:hypothetical protein
MFCKGIFKRVFPFLLTFAAGLFVASFFVTVATPNFSIRSNRGSYRFGELQRLRIENRELRETNCRQRRELEELRRKAATWDQGELPFTVPPVDLDAPPPPPPPRTPRFVK